MRKGLIVGGDSFIGNYLTTFLGTQEFEIFSTSRFRNKKNSSTLFMNLETAQDFKPNFNFEFVVICAGITSVSHCESQPETSYDTNVRGTIDLIDYFINQNCQIVFLSSNLVFEGRKPFYSFEDTPAPQTNYGKFKLEVENYILQQSRSTSAIIRMTKVLPDSSKSFFSWQKNILNGIEVSMFNDVYIAPVKLEEIGKLTQNIVTKKKSGIFHLSSDREISYFEYAKNWARVNSLDEALIKSVICNDPLISKHNSLLMQLPI
jgi:dTDP-4-dehydrorhamnose reductase